MPEMEKNQEERLWEKREAGDQERDIERAPSPEHKEEPLPTKEGSERAEAKEAGERGDIEQKDIGKKEISPEKEGAGLDRIEGVLQEGLEDTYKELPEAKKEEFRIKGEKVAREIFAHLGRPKPKPAKMAKMITSWLSVIPEFSGHYIEQSAKNKTDKLLRIINKEHDE
jgi:hypothetical protein